MGEKDFTSIDDCRELVVDFYKGIDLPHTLPEIKTYLQGRFDRAMECECEKCRLKAYAVAETFVLLEELAKVVPEENVNAAAGLFCRFHESRLGVIKMAMDEAESKVRQAGDTIGAALGSLMGKAGFIEVKGEQAAQMMEMLRSAVTQPADDESDESEVVVVDPKGKLETAPTND